MSHVKNVIVAFNLIKNSTIQGIISGANNTFPVLSLGNNCDSSSIPIYVDYSGLSLIDGFNFNTATENRDGVDISNNVSLSSEDATIMSAKMFDGNTVELTIQINAHSTTGTMNIGTISNCTAGRTVYGSVNYVTSANDIGKVCWARINTSNVIQVWFAAATTGKIEISFTFPVARQVYKQKINS
jgi:hypothetical protein